MEWLIKWTENIVASNVGKNMQWTGLKKIMKNYAKKDKKNEMDNNKLVSYWNDWFS